MNKDKKQKEKYKMGAISTNKIGSECQFQICTIDEWDDMTEEERERVLVESMWDSGVIDIYPID